MMPSPGERFSAVKQPRVLSQAVISAWAVNMGQVSFFLFHLLTGNSQPSNQTTLPAAGRRSALCQVIPNRPHPCPVAHGMVFAVSNSFAVFCDHTRPSWSLGHLCPLRRAKPQPGRTQFPRPAFLCRLALNTYLQCLVCLAVIRQVWQS
jgi:hypothetical protein